MKKRPISYRSRLILIGLLFVLLSGVLSIIFLLINRQTTTSKAQSASTGPTLSLKIPSVEIGAGIPLNIARGENFDLQLILNTLGNQVKAVDFELNYDSGKLTFQNQQDLESNIQINPNSGFNQNLVIRKIDEPGNRITIGMAVNSSNSTPIPVSSTTDIVLATIKFSVRPDAALGPSQLVPATISKMYSLNTQNILGCVGGLNFDVVETSSTGLSFLLFMPDITADNVTNQNVRVELRQGGTTVETVSTELTRSGGYFATTTPVVFNNAVSASYDIFVKTSVTVGRIFNNVNLTRGQTLDCTVNDSLCGELASTIESKQLWSGDSDGFNTGSGSWNKVDSADLQILSQYFNQQSSGPASAADFNLDGQVDISDLEIIGKNYGQSGD